MILKSIGSPALQCQDRSKLTLLALVWDKTASGTARSKTEDRLHIWSVPHLFMGYDCLRDSEQQHRVQTSQLICSSLHYGTRMPLKHWGATQQSVYESTTCDDKTSTTNFLVPFFPKKIKRALMVKNQEQHSDC